MNNRIKVLITGGAGFIGSHLAEELANRGCQVVILDNLSTGRLDNIERLIKRENVEFIKGSVTNLSLLRKLSRGATYIFHQAAIPSVPRSVGQPFASHEANATGTLKVLLAARDNGVRKVIYASSSSVYGNNPVSPKREDMIPNPLSPYAVTKLAGEYYCKVFQEIYGLNTVCLRYFNIYGPRQNPNSQYAAVIPRFMKRVSEGTPPFIYGDGEQSRDFTFVKDVIAANILAMESNSSGIYNIGRGDSTTVNQLARLIINLLGKNLEPVHQEPRPGDVSHNRADITRAKTFGYEPKYSLVEGLQEVVGQFKNAA